MTVVSTPPNAIHTYTELPVAVVSQPNEQGFTQAVAYPSYPKGGRKVFYRGAASLDDALKAVADLRKHAPNQGFAVLTGSIMGYGSVVLTPLGTPRMTSARNIPMQGRLTSDKAPLAITPSAAVATANAGLQAIVRSDGSVIRFDRPVPHVAP